MQARNVNSSPYLFAIALLVWVIAMKPLGAKEARDVSPPFVDDEVGLFETSFRQEVEEDLEAFAASTDCWIQIRALEEILKGRGQKRLFRETWAEWGKPECAVVLFLLTGRTKVSLMFAPTVESRLTEQEIIATIQGVIVPRLENEDSEGAVLAGIESLQVALTGELKELPSVFRPRGHDLWIGTFFVAIAIGGFLSAIYLTACAVRDQWKAGRTPR